MLNIGPLELVIVLAIALIVLGPKRLPEAGRSLGRGLRSFKDALIPGDDGPELELLRAEEKPESLGGVSASVGITPTEGDGAE